MTLGEAEVLALRDGEAVLLAQRVGEAVSVEVTEGLEAREAVRVMAPVDEPLEHPEGERVTV